MEAFSKYLASPASEEKQEMMDRGRDLMSTLSWSDVGCTHMPLHHHKGYYLPLPTLLYPEQTFHASPTDVILATTPKSGTTWLKALLFATVNRSTISHDDPRHPLLALNPHQCVPFLEYDVYIQDKILDLSKLPSPRLLSTHIPFTLLPHSIPASGSKIIYLCRDPKDVFVSMWHFFNKLRSGIGKPPLSLEDAFSHFCDGVSMYGPYWDHTLGYWNASQQQPDMVLFVKYEELMRDPVVELKSMAEFVGCPFTEDEEKAGVVQGIVELCSFESLRNMEVNKLESISTVLGKLGCENASFFRKGKVGDSANHLSLEMVRRLQDITKAKFAGSGLGF